MGEPVGRRDPIAGTTLRAIPKYCFSDQKAIRTGDIIACPAGGKGTAHQIINTGTEELRYLAVSTEHCLEMAQYPDSGKFAVGAEVGTAPDGTPQRVIFIGNENQQFNF